MKKDISRGEKYWTKLWALYGRVHLSTGVFVFADLLLALLIVSLFVSPKATLLGAMEFGKNPRALAEQIAHSCAIKRSESCYTDELVLLVKKENFALAEQTLLALQDIDPSTKSCHVVAHYMGREALKKNPSKWLALADTVDVLACGSGFLHGVLEGHLSASPGITLTSALSQEVCDRGADSYRKRMCTHFMGHFFVVDTSGKLDEAFPQCQGVNPALRFDCFDGMFMEDHQKIALTEHNILPAPEYTPAYAKSLEKSCGRYQGDKNIACWVEMAEVYAKTYGYDAKTIYNQCNDNASTDSARQSCYSKGIVILATFPYDVSAKQLTAICEPFALQGGKFEGCASQLISSLMYYSAKFTTRGITFCAGAPSEHKRPCFRELGRQLASLVPSREERVTLCESAPEEVKGLCAGSNKTPNPNAQ